MAGIVWINGSGQQLTWFVATSDGPNQTGPLDRGHRMDTPPNATSAGILGPAPANCQIGAYINPGENGYDCVFFVTEDPQARPAETNDQAE